MALTLKERKFLLAEAPGVELLNTSVISCDLLLRHPAGGLPRHRGCSRKAAWSFKSKELSDKRFVCWQHLFVVMSLTPGDYYRWITWNEKKIDSVIIKLFGRERYEDVRVCPLNWGD